MSALDKILDHLPIPVLAAVASIVFVAWIIKEIRKVETYGPIIQDPYLHAFAVLCVAVLFVYYAFAYIFSREAQFFSNERGILVAKFTSDEKDAVQNQTLETLKTKISTDTNLSDVKVKALKSEIADDEAEDVLEKRNAISLIAGTYVPNTTVHYRLHWRGNTQVARLMISDFPTTQKLEDEFLQRLRSSPIAQNIQTNTIKDLRDQLAALREENARLLNCVAAPVPAGPEIEAFVKTKKYALIVGISQYSQRELHALSFAAADASSIAEALKRTVPNLTSHVLINEAATRVAIMQALKDIRQNATRNDALYIYFSGHSAAARETGFLMPFDGDPSAPLETAIGFAELIDVSQQYFGQAVIMMDAALGPRISTTHSPDSAIGILAAAQPGQLVLEDSALGHGIFTYFVLQGLRGAADIDHRGLIRLKELYDYVSNKMRSASIGANFGKAAPVLVQTGSRNIPVSLVVSRN